MSSNMRDLLLLGLMFGVSCGFMWYYALPQNETGGRFRDLSDAPLWRVGLRASPVAFAFAVLLSVAFVFRLARALGLSL